MAVVSPSHFILIQSPVANPSGPLGVLAWLRASNLPIINSETVNSGSDGLLDAGVDYFGNSSVLFTGHTIDFDGETYAIFSDRTDFSDGSNYFIPYDISRQNIAHLANGGRSTGFTETGARVFNCFATGTRIATPDGDKPIEMLRAGEKVLTHDGRSTPVIWRARQSIANPRNLSVGRGPVRIEAGALGPTCARRSASHRPPTCPGKPPPDAWRRSLKGAVRRFRPRGPHRDRFERRLKGA